VRGGPAIGYGGDVGAHGLIGIEGMASSARVVLDLSSRPENVPVVRQALAGFAEAIALAPADLNDVSTALTEACNNASLHAYAGAEGPVEVELSAAGEALSATVRDRGLGLAAVRVPPELPRELDGEVAGIGLPAIHGLASRVRMSERDGGGTELAMEFATPGLDSDDLQPAREQRAWARAPGEPGHRAPARAQGEPGRHPPAPARGESDRRRAQPEPEPAVPAPAPLDPFAAAPARLADAVELDMAPLSTACAVLPRVVCALGARAYFPVDRLDDLRRLCVLLLADDDRWTQLGRVQAGVLTASAGLELRIGPLRAEAVTPLMEAVRELDPAVKGLASIGQTGSAQRLFMRVPRTPAGAANDERAP
jgi:serine/threonine-protein kinase RsbW